MKKLKIVVPIWLITALLIVIVKPSYWLLTLSLASLLFGFIGLVKRKTKFDRFAVISGLILFLIFLFLFFIYGL